MAARTNIPVQTVPYQGSLQVSYTAGDATNGMQWTNTNGAVVIYIKNEHTAAIQADVLSSADEFGRTGDETRSIPAGEDGVFGPFLTGIWNPNGGNTGLLDLDLDTNVSVAAILLTMRG